MRWADALKLSSNKRVERALLDPDTNHQEPNVLLIDPKFSETTPKLFRAIDNFAWLRIPLRVAKQYDDWRPV